ncbi:helix-turn-helix domain-containing protein [Actinopolyspora mortivallis]|uniref:helix-turn-helix domain-containing protein n=1 Tax=Actinopolyspora mortivallis TaxID=33906 RepID=UPI000A042006|nr:helix-turn-helix transcriptional regulator [Actinopolyspora mortivallis]
MSTSDGNLNAEHTQEASTNERISPTVRLRKLVRRLRSWREHARMRQEDVADVLGWSKAKVSRYENAEQIPGTAEIIALATIYGRSEQERDQYMALAVQARQRGWWQSYGTEALKQDFDEYVGLESEACLLKEYCFELIPGLLQTESYATELMRAWLPSVDTSVTEERAALRAQRQANLYGEHPLALHTVVHECALRQRVGGPEVIRPQLEHLLSMSELPHVTIQVLPFTAGAHPAMDSPFIILSFPDPEFTDVGFAEYLTGCVYVEDPEEVESYSLNFNALTEQALTPTASIDLIRTLVDDI